jgi:hypothetical protein
MRIGILENNSLPLRDLRGEIYKIMEKNYENSVIEILELDTFDFKDLKAIYI